MHPLVVPRLALPTRSAPILRYRSGQLTESGESVMRIGGNTGQLTDSDESVMRIGGILIGQLTDSGEAVMRIGGILIGQSTVSGESLGHENRWDPHRSID